MTEIREPSSIIEMAESIKRRFEYALASGDIDKMGTEDSPEPIPPRARAQMICDVLPDVDYYELDKDFADSVSEVFENDFNNKSMDDFYFSMDYRLPSPTCAFWAKGTLTQYGDQKFPYMYIAQEETTGDGKIRVDIYMVSPYFLGNYIGAYVLEEQGPLLLPTHVMADYHGKQNHATRVVTVAITCSLINQPNFVLREAAGTRQQRRAVARSGGFSQATWSKVRWNVGEAVRQRLERDEPVRCMPLHYTRGHWRRGHEHWTDAVQRSDGGWYKWIDGYWSGHPAFGIRKAVHEPRIKEQVA